MEFENEADYEGLDLLDELVMEDINESLEKESRNKEFN